MDYGNYKETSNFKSLEARENLNKKSKDPISLNATEISQEILKKNADQPNLSQKSLNNQFSKESDIVQIPILEKTNSIVSNCLINADRKDPVNNKKERDHSAQANIKFQFMTEDELQNAIKEATTDEEFDLISNRLLELESQKLDQKEIFEMKKNAPKSTDLKLNDDKLFTLKNIRLIKTPILIQKSQLKHLTIDDVILTNPYTGEVKVSAKRAKNYKIGQIIKNQEENGNVVDFKIRKISILEKDEFEDLKRDLIKHYDALYPTRNEEDKEEKIHDDAKEGFIKSHKNHHRKHTHSKVDEAKNVRQRTSIINIPVAEGKSTKEINETRLKKFEELFSLEGKKIKKSIEKHEALIENIQTNNLQLNIISEEFQIDEKQLNEMITENTKIDFEYKDLMKQLLETKKNISIPLPAIAKFKRFEITFEKITKLVSKSVSKDGYETLVNIIPLKKEVMAFARDFLSSGGVNTTQQDFGR